MKGKFFQVFVKIIVLTGIFFVLINYFWYFLNASESPNKSTNSNKEKFTSKDIEIIGNVWVAIATNIWTRYKQTKETPVNAYKDVIEVWYILWNQNIAKDALITANMVFLNEYFNILKTDIKALLSSSNDREFALNSFIAQLEYRYKAASENMNKLNSQKIELLKAYENSNKEIDSLKTKIWSDFWNFNNTQTIKNIDHFLEIKKENTNALTYIVFVNKFIDYYTTLNNYNKKVLDTLINNKEILIKNTQVVIPDTGWELLKQLKLLYTEEEWKWK